MKTVLQMTKKESSCDLGAIFSKHVRRDFLSQTSWAPFLLVFLELAQISVILQRFSQTLPRFPHIFPGFSQNQNF